MEMSKDEIRQKLDQVTTRLTALEREKVELEVKRDAHQKKVDDLLPQIQEIFGTTDSAELTVKRNELLAQLQALKLDV